MQRIAHIYFTTPLTKGQMCVIVGVLSCKKIIATRLNIDININHMQHKSAHSLHSAKGTHELGNSLVYMYLVAGITLLVAVFLFLPRMSIG